MSGIIGEISLPGRPFSIYKEVSIIKEFKKKLELCVKKELSLEHIKVWALNYVQTFLQCKEFKIEDILLYPFFNMLAYQEYGVKLNYDDIQEIILILDGTQNYKNLVLFQLEENYFETEVINRIDKIINSFTKKKYIEAHDLSFLSFNQRNEEENLYWMLMDLLLEILNGIPLVADSDFEYCSVNVNICDSTMIDFINKQLSLLLSIIKGNEPLFVSIEYVKGIPRLNLLL